MSRTHLATSVYRKLETNRGCVHRWQRQPFHALYPRKSFLVVLAVHNLRLYYSFHLTSPPTHVCSRSTTIYTVGSITLIFRACLRLVAAPTLNPSIKFQVPVIQPLSAAGSVPRASIICRVCVTFPVSFLLPRCSTREYILPVFLPNQARADRRTHGFIVHDS